MRQAPVRGSAASRAPGPPAPALPLSHPASLAALLVAAACVLGSVTFRIIDADFWQHLAVGRALWATREIPYTQVWSWPAWGEPAVLHSWLFRALLWPFWQAGEMHGLFLWRWLTTLTAFGLAWATARRMGARGLAPLVVLVVCALVYRQRSQVRPETLAALLLALTLWLLECRRQGAAGGSLVSRRRAWWLVPVLGIWANAHISYVLGFALLGIHLVDAHLAARRGAGRPGDLAMLWGIAAASLVAALVNPFGAKALLQPFRYALEWRDTALFQGIGELRAVGWAGNETNGLFLLLPAWPLLLLWRARRRGWDVAGSLTCALFTAYALSSQRFLGVYALAAAPYVARDLDALLAGRRWPRSSAAPAVRATLAAGACLTLALPEILRRDSPMRPGLGADLTRYPIAACDFLAAHDLRGRLFNQVRTGGYLLWRFWPDRGRLPFVSIHPEDSPPEIRALYAAVFTDPRAWAELDRRFRFDLVLLDRRQYSADRLLDHLALDATWALVFADDAAVLYLRRDGSQAVLAESLAYRVVPAGREALAALRAACAGDSGVRARARPELERQAAASPWNAIASSLLADLALADQRFAEAGVLLERVLAVNPEIPLANERLGMVAMWERDPRRAIAAFERERRLRGPSAPLEFRLGFAREAAGDLAGARRHYRAALRLDPGNALARERIEALDRGGP